MLNCTKEWRISENINVWNPEQRTKAYSAQSGMSLRANLHPWTPRPRTSSRANQSATGLYHSNNQGKIATPRKYSLTKPWVARTATIDYDNNPRPKHRGMDSYEDPKWAQKSPHNQNTVSASESSLFYRPPRHKTTVHAKHVNHIRPPDSTANHGGACRKMSPLHCIKKTSTNLRDNLDEKNILNN